MQTATVISGLAGLALLLSPLGSNAWAAPPPGGPTVIYAFGDSLSDAGNLYMTNGGTEPITPPYSQGRFTNGRVWVQDLAINYGLSMSPSLSGGSDFAYGGAQTGQTIAHALAPIDLPFQLAQFRQAVPRPDANALFTVGIGDNDLLEILGEPAILSNRAEDDVNQAVDNEAEFIDGLAAAGAIHILVLTVADLGKTPSMTGRGPDTAMVATNLSAMYNQALAAALAPIAASRHLDLRYLDLYTLIDQNVANPEVNGFTNVTAPCWTGSASSYDGTLCAQTLLGQNKYLFWDQIHPTAHGHDVIYGTARTIVNAAPLARINR